MNNKSFNTFITVIRNYILLFSVFIFCGCSQLPNYDQHSNKFSSLQQLAWLKGYWEFEIDDGLFAESWLQLNDSVFLGYGIMIVGEDTVSQEIITLEYFDEELYYVVVASGQNEDQAVKFKLVSESEGVFVFENKAHDFPKRITYNYIDDDHFEAIVEGDEGNQDGFELFMTKIK
jgi:hypothetical protein